MLQEVIDNIPGTIVKESPIHGNGLFTAHKIPKGTILCILDGQIVPWDIYRRQVFSVIPHEWNALKDDCVLLRMVRTKYCFINHSRTPNLELKSFPPMLVALETIEPGTELTLDYRKEPLPEFYKEIHGNSYL